MKSRALKWTAGAIGVAAGAVTAYAGVTWLRYGHPPLATGDEADPLLDRFMPVYDIVERHHVQVAAGADITFAAACEQDLMAAPVAQEIFRAREVLLAANQTRRHVLADCWTSPNRWDGACLRKFRAARWSWAPSRNRGRRMSCSAHCRQPSSPRSTNPTTSRSCGRCAPIRSMRTLRSFAPKRALSRPTRLRGESSGAIGRSCRRASS